MLQGQFVSLDLYGQVSDILANVLGYSQLYLELLLERTRELTEIYN